MAGADIPGIAGLSEILAAAAEFGIDLRGTVDKVQQLMQTKPADMRAGSEKLISLAGGMGSVPGDLRKTGSDVLARWTGEAAATHEPFNTGLVNSVADTVGSFTQLAGQISTMASGFDEAQRVVQTATAMAKAQLDILKRAAPLVPVK